MMRPRLVAVGLPVAALAAACAEVPVSDGTVNVGGGSYAVNGTCAPHGELFLDYTCDHVEGPDPTSQSEDGPSVKVLSSIASERGAGSDSRASDARPLTPRARATKDASWNGGASSW